MSHHFPRPTKATARAAAVLLGCAMLAALLLLPGSLAAQATGRITGTVTGEGGLPLASVQVSIPATGIGAVTGTDGRYTITGVAAGTHEVRAQRIGYAPMTRRVTIADGQTVESVDFQPGDVTTAVRWRP